MGDPTVDQSVAAQPPEAQPDQGGDPTGGSQGGFGDLYDLSEVPEELRPFVEEQVKKVAANANRKFEEHSDYRKQWEPFENVEGLSDMDPETLQELVKFQEVASDPESFFQWWDNITEDIGDEHMDMLESAWEQVGQRHGFFDDDGSEGEFGNEFGGDDEMGGDGEPPAWAQALMDDVDQLKQGVEPLREHVTSQEQAQHKQEAQQWIAGEFKRLGVEDGEEQEVISRLAMAYDPNDDKAIEKAYGDYQRIKGNGQQELVGEAGSRPGPATSGGTPDTAPEQFQGLDDPALKASVKARFAGRVGS